jgi:RHS repeat-associated protein
MHKQTNPLGQTEESCVSLPFGDGLNCTATALSTADDATEQHFTGKEHDAESGNEYFEARYLSSTLGRFLTPDWAAKPTNVPYATFGDPQTLNLYSYVENGPLNRVDADGHATEMMGLDVIIGLADGSYFGGTCGFSPCPPAGQAAATDAKDLAEAQYEAQIKQASASTGNNMAQPAQATSQAQQTNSDKNTDVMLYAGVPPTPSGSAVIAQMNWEIVPQANTAQEVETFRNDGGSDASHATVESIKAQKEKFSGMEVRLLESQRGGPEKWMGDKNKGGGVDQLMQNVGTANQKWYVDGKRVQVVVGADSKGNLTKAWTVHVDITSGRPVYSKVD